MLNIPSARLTIPKAINGELVRHKLIDAILNSPAKAVYIHGGAGYGKTTLLSQVARNVEKAVWLSLDGENDIFTFVDTFCAAVKQTFPEFDFSASEYLPFCEKNNFISILAGALISTIENILVNFIVVMNDLHTIVEEKVKKLILYLIKHPPKNVKFCFGSRETLPQDLLPFKIKGNLIELTQNELAFTREEITNILGFCDSSIYDYTEGWPLAICFFKVLLENSKPISNISSYSKETLYTYLFNECIANLSPDMVDFLKKSACFDELEAQMLDEVLNKKDTKLMLESLVSRNIFTVKTSEGFYRYHALFRSSLLDMADKNETSILMQKATRYYFDHKQYSRAAKYAIDSKDYKLLHKIILTCYRDYIKAGNFSELGIWFKALDDASVVADPLILVAKGAYLSFIGNFVQANACLEAAIPLMNENDKLLYFEAMIHKARVLRNFVSFEQSNKLLDELIEKLDNSADELAYSVVIEKLYNLCWNSQIDEAYTLARHMIEKCANAGNIKVKRWFERYLCTICFFKGNMKKSVYYYEKLLDLNEDEQNFLGVHSTAIYVAKAYQMMGDRSRSLSVLSQELSRLRNTGNYEEMWAGYLLAAEIYYQNAFIDRMNGKDVNFETAVKCFTLAEEYAPLYRKTSFQMHWVEMQRLTYSLMFTNNPKEEIIRKIFGNLDKAGAYLKCIVYARLMGYYSAVSDYPNAVKCARLCIETGEKSGLFFYTTLAYGVIARAAIAANNKEEATVLTSRYLKLCAENGIYEYFKIRETYDPVLEFAYRNRIEPEFTAQMMEFVGYRLKKLYVETLGAFTVYHDRERKHTIKFRSKKERELLAFLLDMGDKGATKEQIQTAIWWDSESRNIKNLIAVNLNHIKNDLKSAGITESVVYRGNRYFIHRDQIECDFELFEKAYKKFRLKKTKEYAKEIISLYKGEYLSDFEAFWAASKKIKYSEIYDEAKRFLS